MKKVNTFLLFILVLLVIGCIVTGALYHFTDVIKVKSPSQDKPSLETPIAPDKPNEVVVNKELVSTTYVSEKYGTFEVPVNHIVKNTNDFGPYTYLYFPNGTNLVPLFEGTIAYEKEYPDCFNPVEIAVEDVRFVIDVYSYNQDKILNRVELTYDESANKYYFTDNKIIYKNGEGYDIFMNFFDMKYSDRTLSGRNSFCTNVFVTSEKQIVDMSENLDGSKMVEFPIVKMLISDNGTPLTEKIYKEMLQDPATKILKNYN